MSTAILPADPKAGYLAQREAIDAAVQRVLASGWYIKGEEVSAFEAEFARYLGAAHAVGVASGTDALTLALRTLGVGSGDVVFTVSHTAVATVAAIELAGARPVFVDIDPGTFTMSPERLAEAVAAQARVAAAGGRGRPRAVIPVHLYGHPADMPGIVGVARQHRLLIIEDCAQAHGALVTERRVGTWGDMAAFSFYPTKNLGALGDAGAVATADAGLAERARLLREYGWRERYISDLAGMNTRLDPLQAAILRVKLAVLDADNDRRRAIARCYTAALAPRGWCVPTEAAGCRHVYHQYVVRHPDRDAVMAHLRRRGIGTLIHYPVPVHQQPAYQGRIPVAAGSLARTESVCREILSLPMHPWLSDADVARVIEGLLAFPP